MGSGIDLVILLGELYRFETHVEDYAIDGKPCIRLDNPVSSTPLFIRAIRDEVREVWSGLFPRPAMIDGRPLALALWLGLDTRAG